MIRFPRRAATAALAVFLAAAACSPAIRPALVDPFPLRLPLVEAGSLEIEGRVVGQPRAQDGILYYVTQGGHLTELVVSSRNVLRRYEVDDGPAPASASPDTRVEAGGRVYFGDSERTFYCLSLATGKMKWKRRLQGAPLHPAIVFGRRVAVVASNSTLYFLSGRGGSILSWEAIPSRVVFEPARAGESLLVSPAGDRVLVFDLRTGERIGQHLISGTLAAGAIWSPPFVVLVEEDNGSGRQRLVFLRSR